MHTHAGGEFKLTPLNLFNSELDRPAEISAKNQLRVSCLSGKAQVRKSFILVVSFVLIVGKKKWRNVIFKNVSSNFPRSDVFSEENEKRFVRQTKTSLKKVVEGSFSKEETTLDLISNKRSRRKTRPRTELDGIR